VWSKRVAFGGTFVVVVVVVVVTRTALNRHTFTVSTGNRHISTE
jgi:hypothetical protein